MKKFRGLLLTLFMVFMLTACSSKPSGTYKYIRTEHPNGSTSVDFDDMTLEMKSDGTVYLRAGSDEMQGSFDESYIYFYEEGSPMGPYKVKGKELIWTFLYEDDFSNDTSVDLYFKK